jgi:hypothetical protein
MDKLTQSYVHGASVLPLIGDTIGVHFDRVVARWPKSEALVVRHQRVRWTYVELQRKVDAFAGVGKFAGWEGWLAPAVPIGSTSFVTPDFLENRALLISGASLTNVPFERSLTNAEIVFSQYGIKAEFASGESIGLSEDERELFNQIDQECAWDLDDGEFNQLQSLGSSAPSNDVLVFHVSTFADGNTLGCGGHAKNRPACTITASALAWDTAHEVCHVLLGSSFNPVHINDLRNLMHPISRTLLSVPVLTSNQVARIRNSVCCSAI